MHVPRQQQPEGWVAIGYAYRHWKQALSRRAGIDKKDATPKQITTFQERVDVLSASKEMAQATKLLKVDRARNCIGAGSDAVAATTIE